MPKQNNISFIIIDKKSKDSIFLETFGEVEDFFSQIAGEYMIIYDECHIMQVKKEKINTDAYLEYRFKKELGINNP